MYKNIIFLKLETDIIDALKYSTITTTVTGEAGLQSLLLGKPSIIFGNPWYKNFKYITSIINKKEFNQTLIDKVVKLKISKKIIFKEFHKLANTRSIKLIYDENSWELKNVKDSTKMRAYLKKNMNFFKKNLIK